LLYLITQQGFLDALARSNSLCFDVGERDLDDKRRSPRKYKQQARSFSDEKKKSIYRSASKMEDFEAPNPEGQPLLIHSSDL